MKIESESFSHEICSRALENNKTFRNYRQLIKKSIVNRMKYYSTSDISNMKKTNAIK